MKSAVASLIFLGYFISVQCVHFEVDDRFSKLACILMNIDASFNVTYTDNGTKEEATPFSIQGANVDNSSVCGYAIPIPRLSVRLFPSREMLSFSFLVNQNTVFMSVRFMLQPKMHFIATNITRNVPLNSNGNLAVGRCAANSSYLCNTEEILVLKGSSGGDSFAMTVKIKHFQVQAFNVSGKSFSPAVECGEDFSTTVLPPSNITTEPTETTSLEPMSSTESNITAEPQSISTSETTTHVGPETTKITTMTKPETTEPKPDTTAVPKPDTTTNHEHESSTSTIPESSPVPQIETTLTVIPTTHAQNRQHKYMVRNGHEVCILLHADIAFEIPYQKHDGNNASVRIPVPDNVIVDGNCNYNNTDTIQDITLTFFDTNWVLGIIISKKGHADWMTSETKNSGPFSWQEVTLSYELDSNFHNAKDMGKRFNIAVDEPFGIFEANTDGSYKCIDEKVVDFGKDSNVKMKLTKMQYRAFGNTNSTTFADTGVSECSEDSKKGSHRTLGIALGCSFAALSIVILVIWGLSRRRKKQQEKTPYEEIQ